MECLHTKCFQKVGGDSSRLNHVGSGLLDFGASCGLKVREETGRLSPSQSVTAFRLSAMVIGRCVPDYI